MKEFYPRSIQDIKESYREGNVIMPGSFNPLHSGHRAIIKHAEAYTKRTVFLEHCVNSLDKPDSSDRIVDVVAQAWNAGRSIYITDANMFVYKSEVFKKPIFAIGADTFGRIIDPKYRDNSKQSIRNDLNYMRSNGAQFLVYPRIIDGVTVTMTSFDISGLDLYNFTDMGDRYINAYYPYYPLADSSTKLRSEHFKSGDMVRT